MNIEQIDIRHIRPYPANAKKHPKKQVEQIANSIKEFGFNQPIVTDEDGIIVVGHGRYEAAKLLTLDTVPVLKIKLTEEQARSYRLADNKLNESDWDMKLVIDELKELSLPMLDLTGFSRDLILENDDKDDVLPAMPKVFRSKPGDIYQLGPHRLIVGDSTKPETYTALMAGAHADMVFTDPPYNVNYKGSGKETSRTIENDHMAEDLFIQFLSDFFVSAVGSVKGGSGWYVFHSSSSQDSFMRAMHKADLEIKAQLIWNKPTASMGWGDYRWKHEPFFYAGRKGNKLVFYGDRTHKTVIDLHEDEKKLIEWIKKEKRLEKMGLSTIWTMKRDKVNEYEHPTQKPVELITYAIANSSKTGDIILDPFLGSGSTLIAAEKTSRTCYGIELDLGFADLIVQRYVDYTEMTEIQKNGTTEVWERSDKSVAASIEGEDTEL